MFKTPHNVLYSLCLRSFYSLRKQLIVSFGSVAVITLAVIVVLAIASALSAGNLVRYHSREMMREQVMSSIQDSSVYAADTFTQQHFISRGVASIMVEIVRDRIVGYPNEGYKDDFHVPFFDFDSRGNKYPIRSSPLPRDWNITLNLMDKNDEILSHHLQERVDFFRPYLNSISTATAFYKFQGNCDPSQADPNARSFYPNCTTANNDITTGGVVQPVESNRWLAEKAADIAVLLKPLWEATPEAIFLEVSFHNSGPGSYISFPGFIQDSSSSYISIGCDWMEAKNIYTGKPLATPEEISRCHPADAMVQMSEYNPMEQGFCRDQALHPGETRIYGPLQKPGDARWWLVVGQAVFDRMTGHFIGCTAVHLLVSSIEEGLSSSIIGNNTDAALVRVDGTLVACAEAYMSGANRTLHVGETDFVNRMAFDQLVSGVDWGKNWTQDIESGRLKNNIHDFRGRLLHAYPIPSPPRVYDPNYKPDFYIIFSVGGTVFDVIDEIDYLIDEEVSELIRFSLLFAGIGAVFLLVVILIVSIVLTHPLKWIQSVSWKIVNSSTGGGKEGFSSGVVEGDIKEKVCSPRTEIAELVSEFRKMIEGFSGNGPSSVAEHNTQEIPNLVHWQTDFLQLYSKVNPNKLSSEIANSTVDESFEPFERPTINIGSNLVAEDFSSKKPYGQDLKEALCSSLFRWIVGLIALPLLVTNTLICTTVAHAIIEEFPSLVGISETLSIDVEVDSLNAAALLRAEYTEAIFREPIRNVHFLTRVAGWLLFDGINRSDSFTDVEIGLVEECKTYPDNNYSCPFFWNETRAPCDCQWNDIWQRTCRHYDTDTRYLQKMFFLCQNGPGNDPTNGNRPTSNNFPSAEKTAWWSNISSLPGALKGSSASGYDTTYDRARVLSALSVVHMPIYNYVNTANNLNDRVLLASYFGSEADGALYGYAGCNWQFAQYAHIKFNQANIAGNNRPDLCKLGDHGYDSRCRPWYSNELQSTTPVTISPPYAITPDDIGSGSVGASLVDPRSGEYVGQTLIDFSPPGLIETLDFETRSHFYFVISPDAINEEDTVFATGYVYGNNPQAIADVVLQYDDEGSPNRVSFARIIKQMKDGRVGNEMFSRLLGDGSEEQLRISFAPVFGRSLVPMRADSFSEGADVSEILLYSLAVVRLEDSLERPFVTTEERSYGSHRKIAWSLSCLAFFISILCVVVTAQISVAITSPILTLLRIVKNINSAKFDDDIPPLKGGSRESMDVHNSFGKLYKVVQLSNTAFFSGNLVWAYRTVKSALQLFRKCNDQKAIGIACNNLGNTLHALFRHPVELASSEFDGINLEQEALQSFDESIRISQTDFDRAVESKAEFACQLADRLFNRALFLLFLHYNSRLSDSRKQAMEDMSKASALDNDVVDSWLADKLLLEKSANYFDRLIRRINGLLDFYQDNELQTLWNVESLISDAQTFLSAAWEEDSAPLFRKITRFGRLQQMEAVLIRHHILTNNVIKAGQLAMRMFVEDEFILQQPFCYAARALCRTMREKEMFLRSPVTKELTDQALRKMTKSSKHNQLELWKCLVICIEIKDKKWLAKVQENLLRLYDKYCWSEDYIGLVAATQEGNVTLKPSLKIENGLDLRASLGTLTTSLFNEDDPALPHATMLALDSAGADNENYLLLLTDGHSYHHGGFGHKKDASSLKSLIEQLSSRQHTKVNILILGLEVQDADAVEAYKVLASITKKSRYINVTRSNIDEVFSEVGGLLQGCSRAHQHFFQSFAMETF